MTNENKSVPESPTKKCPFCAEQILQDAIICKHCKSDLNSASNHSKQLLTSSNYKRYIIEGIILIFLFFFLLSVHIFIDVPTIIAKDHLTFADTFVTVDDFVQRYNNAPPLARIGISQSHIFVELQEKGLIHQKEYR